MFGMISFVMMIISGARAIKYVDIWFDTHQKMQRLGVEIPDGVETMDLLFHIGLPLFFLSSFIFAITRHTRVK